MLFQDINRLIGYDERQRMVPTDREALTAIVSAVRDPKDYATLRALGVGLLLLGEYEASFPLQHLGKALGELGRVEEAREVLLEALALRQGEPELVVRTEAALRLLEPS